MQQFKAGDKVFLIDLHKVKYGDQDDFPGILQEMISFSRQNKDKLLTIRVKEKNYSNLYRLVEDKNNYLYNVKWLKLGIQLSKEEQLLGKIDQLWKRQQWYKERYE